MARAEVQALVTLAQGGKTGGRHRDTEPITRPATVTSAQVTVAMVRIVPIEPCQTATTTTSATSPALGRPGRRGRGGRRLARFDRHDPDHRDRHLRARHRGRPGDRLGVPMTAARFPALRQGYESLYLRACHPDGGLGVWIRYTVNVSAATGSLWFTLFEESGPTARKLTLPDPEPANWLRI